MGWNTEAIINIVLGVTGLLLGYFYFPDLIVRAKAKDEQKQREKEAERVKERVREHKPIQVTGHRAPKDVPPPNCI